MNILDKIDGNWKSICDRGAEGSEIEKIMISPLGCSDQINIIVGYSTANQSEKYLSVYAYENNYLEQTLTHSYALFDIAETDPERHPDLILLGAVSTAEQAYAAVYRLEEDKQYHEYKYLFANNYTEYHQLINTRLPGGQTVFYIDAAAGTGNLQTEVLNLEETEEIGTQLVNQWQRAGRGTEETIRRAGLSCMDIDHDGVPEIPVQTVFPGYEDVAESEQLRMTNWLTIQKTTVFTEYQSYYNANDGYVFLLPETWKKHVTVRNSMTENEIQFCAYDGEMQEDMPVLLRIYMAYDEADRDDHLGAGYQLLHARGTASCLIRSEPGQMLSVPLGDLILCFEFLD